MSKKKTTKNKTDKKRKLPPKIEKTPPEEIPPEIKEQRLDFFVQKSDELAEAEAKKRRESRRKKVEFIGGASINLEEYILEVMAPHETKFEKAWFYRLADLFGVDRKVMDEYVKPDFVRLFIIQFVYGRFPRLLLRTLRSRNRKLGGKGGKLHQHLSKSASEKLITVIKQVYEFMEPSIGKGPLDFKMKYSKEYTVYFQVDLF